MICSNCGSEVQDGMKFCELCGTPVPQTETNFTTMDIIIKVGKNQQIKTLKEALKNIIENGTIILEPGVYKEHVNFDKKVKLVGATDSIMDKSSSELPIIVLDSTKSCEISAPVEIEGVVFTHEENLSFNNLQS
jgi:hypothetical protein